MQYLTDNLLTLHEKNYFNYLKCSLYIFCTCDDDYDGDDDD